MVCGRKVARVRPPVWVETLMPPVFGKENGGRWSAPLPGLDGYRLSPCPRRAWRAEGRREQASQPCWSTFFFPRTSAVLFVGEGEGVLEIRAAVVTVSDKGYAGEREDVSGPVLSSALTQMGAEVVDRLIVPDEPDQISATLIELADRGDLDLIITTGGTGATPRDNTPEATQRVIQRSMPGLGELLRAEGYKKTPLAVLSRGVAGLRGSCLIINLPGSPRAVSEGMETLTPVLPHAVQMARGEDTEHGDHHHGH